MSWQATAWAAKQVTGSASNKLTLLALANYADDKGICWPTQETLARDTEQSIDTVQRRIKSLVKLGLVRVETRPGGRGRWDGRKYHLAMGVAEMSKPQSAARSKPENEPPARLHHAAPGPATIPHQARSPYRTAVRCITSKEPPIEPPARTTPNSADERLQAFQSRSEPTEVIQNRIAQRLGSEGWLILGELSDAQRARLTTLQRRGELDDAALASFAASVRLARPPP
ncbi:MULTISPECIES: helix-turn-helix domain-containing protein [Bradyrhizobium]|uniref:helix-turn-helix domain-containing protein n=1 Tax=Bradyrhizobium TaxID=374 RepID=UPI000687B5EE|nr:MULTISPECIES: helix-turn-helix domain-containing protein [unclassified Bradyrhizobium]